MPLTIGSLIDDVVGAPQSAVTHIADEGERFIDTVTDEFQRSSDDVKAELQRAEDNAQSLIDNLQEASESFIQNARNALAQVPLIGPLFDPDALSLTDKIIIAVVALSAIGLLATIVTGRRKGSKG